LFVKGLVIYLVVRIRNIREFVDIDTGIEL